MAVPMHNNHHIAAGTSCTHSGSLMTCTTTMFEVVARKITECPALSFYPKHRLDRSIDRSLSVACCKPLPAPCQVPALHQRTHNAEKRLARGANRRPVQVPNMNVSSPRCLRRT